MSQKSWNAGFVIVALLLAAVGGCQSTQSAFDDGQEREIRRTAQAGCASCIFHMKDAEDCPLAVKIDGQVYLVEGSSIDDHGDAHAPDGLCKTARIASVAGRIESGRFVATHFELTP